MHGERQNGQWLDSWTAGARSVNFILAWSIR